MKIPDFYEFQHNTKIISGRYGLENLAAELRQMGAKRPLLLSDAGLEAAGIVRLVTDSVQNNGMKWAAVYTDIPRDSSLDVVNRIAAFYREKQCDALVALGGGSVIDTAKGVKMVLSSNAEDILQLAGCECIKRGRRILFAAIPTTAGTGSESTLVAVIRDELRKQKLEFISYELQPDVAVLDPRTTLTLPPLITATTGMDALCHAIEAFICMQKNPVSDAYAAAAMNLIRENLVKAVKNGQDEKARLAMANASMLAGAAFSNSMVGLVHAIGHALGSVCLVPHGHAMTILLPYVLMYQYHKLSPYYAEMLLYLAGPDIYAATPEEKRAREAIRAIMIMKHKLHKICYLPEKLREAGVARSDFDRIAELAVNDGAMIVSPVPAEKQDILHILEKAY
ncbi:MAG: iron-containing alcohol dehydrogenase [Lachnospiraceae bacterium]|nr:iron-containing alcohol dehydrogenase [Lachnospiraceae bacterium]